MNQYGINIDTLDTLLARPKSTVFKGGSRTLLLNDTLFRFERIELKKGTNATFKTGSFETSVWVEEGAATVSNIPLKEHESVTIPSRTAWRAKAGASSVLYFFSGPGGRTMTKKQLPFDYRDKYWGNIQSIVSKKKYAAKRMLVKKGTQASLEFHCNKVEGYYIHSGTLFLRLRAGRGEDRFFTLTQGMTAFIPPGLMHQRGGLEDTVILEISTRDEDSDSYLVEDGNIPMPKLARMIAPPNPKKKKICVDIDGCLCSPTKGDYENAKPYKKAVDAVNYLYDKGHYIMLYTSRFMGRTGSSVPDAYKLGYEFTQQQLKGWGVKYHELLLGKPRADIVIDDRAVFFDPDWDKIKSLIAKKR
jgi:mannose-6-phosphate isomerase-like protein (cupin superfamily)